VVGYASRTGSPLHNLRLSTERANSVGKYLRFRAVGRGLVSVPAVTVNASVGESAAEAAGVKDGTEDALYRAVHVKAWSKPTPPPPPAPKPPAPKKQVVIFRRFQKNNVNQPSEPGGIGGDLGGAGKDAIWPDYGQSSYGSVPSDYAVNGVRDDFTIDWEMIAGGSDTTYTREITYTWGPRADMVHLLDRTREIQHGGRWTINKRGFFSRSEIWKHTLAPDAKEPGL
jgi:hypothetical protein